MLRPTAISPEARKSVRAGIRNGPSRRRAIEVACIVDHLTERHDKPARAAVAFSLDWWLPLGSEPRRRRASVALCRARGWRPARAALTLLAGTALLIAGLGVFRVWSAIHAISPRAQPVDLITMVHAGTDDPGSLGWKIKHDQRINVLLLGYGGPGHDGPYLTDSIMLLSIRPSSHEAIMISLPRDLWVKIPALPNNRYMMGKLNSAYAIGIDHRNYPNVRSDWKTDTGGGDLEAGAVSQVTRQR